MRSTITSNERTLSCLVLSRLRVALIFAGLCSAASAQTDQPLFNPAITQSITTLLLSDCGPRYQDTYLGDVLIQNQADIEALSGIAIIDGELRIESTSNLNFRTLDGLVEVKQGIRFDNNPNLTRISGFNCLIKARSLLFYQNPALLEISGFESLESLGSYLEITNSDNTTTALLKRISGFQSLKSLEGGIVLYRLPFLESIPFFSSLETVGATIDINRVTNIKDIPGFVNLTSVGRDLIIRRNNNLERITGFDRLSSSNIGRNIEVYSNITFDCTNPAPPFLPTTRSDNNEVDC